MEDEPSWEPLLKTDAGEFSAAISPDGQLIAYVSNETEEAEVYVQRFPDLRERRQISAAGALYPLWSPDGRALYYLGTGGNAPDDMRVVTIDPGPPLSVGSSEVLFDHTPYTSFPGPTRNYDIAPDGQRFLMLSQPGTALETGATLASQINVVLNWHQELLERVPVP